jgi:hypothetical protein
MGFRQKHNFVYLSGQRVAVVIEFYIQRTGNRVVIMEFKHVTKIATVGLVQILWEGDFGSGNAPELCL